MSPAVSVIIVNWNGKYLLLDCLDSLFNQTFRDFEVILVDNGSTDGSIRYVEEEFPMIKIIHNEKNLGFAEANNQGIMVSRGEYIALLNNDTRPKRNWLAELVRVADENPRFGMFASKILLPSGKIDSAGCLLYPDGIGICRGRWQENRGQYDQIETVVFPSGCAAFYRRQMLDQIGPFDERFFMYCEDTDLGLRARAAGWGCLYIPTAVVTHLYSQSSSAYSLKKAFYVERNRIWVMMKNFSFAQIVSSVPYTLIRYFRIARRGMAWSSGY